MVGRLDQGEEDRILRVLTAERGLVSLWCNRARRARSPWAALDLGVRAAFTWSARGAETDLHTALGADVLAARIGLRARLERLGPAAFACETAAGLATTAPEPRLYGGLETALLLLDQHPEDPARGLLAALASKFLTFAGLTPALERCPACQAVPAEPMAWCESGGGAFHVAHLPPDVAGAPRIPLETLAALAALRRMPLLEAWSSPVDPAPLLSLVEHHLGRALHARVWLVG